VDKKWVFWLEELRQDQHALVGRKCANLGEMVRMGLKVPAGFALCTETYLDFMNISGAVDEIQKCINAYGTVTQKQGQFNELSTDIQQIIQSKVMPKEMEEAILKHYADLCQKCNTQEVAVSVRSAGPESHPGQYETYLNVIGEAEILDKIKKVWASTFNLRSLVFRSRKGMPLGIDPIGVAVLKMVNARAAGVIFTADPNTGDTSRMIIEANWGLGESVVSGESTPDVYIVKKDSLEVTEKRLGLKSRWVIPGSTGVIETETPTEKSSSYCLHKDEITAIAKLGKILEDHFGMPQDIEWAIDQDEKIHANIVLLQVRPEVIIKKKSYVDQVADLMLDHFSGGTKYKGGI
jgi:pyruvate,water dikinase